MANSYDIPIQNLHAGYGYCVRHRSKDFILGKKLSRLKMPTPIIIYQNKVIPLAQFDRAMDF
jgi:hypothetical protein